LEATSGRQTGCQKDGEGVIASLDAGLGCAYAGVAGLGAGEGEPAVQHQAQASSMDFLSFDARPVYVTALFAFDRHRVRTRAAGISMPVANLEACARPWQRRAWYGAPADD